MRRERDDDEPTPGRNRNVTSEAQASLREEEAADPRPETAEQPAQASGVPADSAEEETGRRWRRRQADDDGGEPPSGRPSVPLVPFLAGLLVLLLAGTAFLVFTSSAVPVSKNKSSVRTTYYAEALEAARSEVVDLTSFDYVTLDEDIARIKRVSIGDLQKESVGQLDKQRQQLTQAQAVVSTEVVGAGVTRADSSSATVLLVIQSTEKSAASPQAQVVRYRIEAQLTKANGKWLLSGLSGR